MNLEVFVTLVAFFIGTPIAVTFSSFYERYRSRISTIKTAVLGLLITAKDELVDIELKERDGSSSEQKNEKEIYDNFISFMHDSKFLKYSNEYEDMVYYERKLEKDIHKASISFGFFVIPLIIIQFDDTLIPVALLVAYLIAIFFLLSVLSLRRKIKDIDKLYWEHVLSKQSFGGYDYDD